MTKAEVVRWRDALSETVARGQNVRLNLAESGPWDIAGLQLMLALIASCDRAGLHLALTAAPQVFVTVAERAGVLDRFAWREES